MVGIVASIVVGSSLGIRSQVIELPTGINFPKPGETSVYQYKDVNLGTTFTEVIPSWNVKNAPGARVKIEIQAKGEDWQSGWYVLAKWNLDVPAERVSVNGQSDAFGRVLTDTLRLLKPAKSLNVKVSLSSTELAREPHLSLLTLALTDRTREPLQDSPAKSPAWGKIIDVPQRAQGNYPRGGVLCSAASTSMLLWHYSRVLKTPTLDQDVPVVEASVWDAVYKGAGNWPFNTAFAGSFSPLQAYVARFDGLQDLERLIEAGFPIICSVSYYLLQGKELKADESGHLVVLVGFTKDGDPIFNDPGRRAVRLTYKRADFEKGWNYSARTSYVIHPVDAPVPFRPWRLKIEPIAVVD